MNDKSKEKKSKPTELTTARKRGRPPVYVMPDPIPETPKNVARAILNTPPKKDNEWDFLKPGSKAKR